MMFESHAGYTATSSLFVRQTVDMGEVFSRLPRFLRAHNGHQASKACSALDDGTLRPIQNTALTFADYVTTYLSARHNEPYVSTRYEPNIGPLHQDRRREEPHFQLCWEPCRLDGLRTVYELNIGAHDVAFIASLVPTNRRNAIDLIERLERKHEALVDAAWENSLRFLPGADLQAWQRWSTSYNVVLPFAPGQRPYAFAVFFEARLMHLPETAAKIGYYLSDSVRRTASVLKII